MEVKDTVSVTVSIQTTAQPSASYNQLLLLDTADVPVDRRYIDVTRSSYTTDLTSGTTHYKWAQQFWSQQRTAQTLRIGRWAKAATAAYVVAPDAETTVATWTALAGTGQLKVVEGAANEDINPDFTGDTSMSDVAASFQTALQAGVLTAAYTCTIDNVGRLVITSDNAGASADAVSYTTPAAGVDLSSSTYLGTGVSVAGLDAEEPSDALTAISALTGGDNYYDVAIRGESAAQQQTLAAYIEALDKQLTLVTSVAADKDPSSTTDVPYLLSALNYNNTKIIYTEHDIDELVGMVDAATQGCCLPAQEGSVSWASQELTGVYESGKDGFGSPLPLTTTERNALEAKNCNYIVDTGNTIYQRKGLNCSGTQTNIVLVAHWMQNEISSKIHSYNIVTDIPAFDNETLSAYERIVREVLQDAKERKAIIDTRDRPITVDFPDADDFSDSERASHTMTLNDVFYCWANSQVNDVVITGEIRE